ncbi:MAG: hypothetical protein A4E45_00029 [Methanosaeta sp. PtaB.Bin039]|nr:MAG: hypothetical protein A4E45_00029 [Methanosaeta sp. PtaB.Bin039]
MAAEPCQIEDEFCKEGIGSAGKSISAVPLTGFCVGRLGDRIGFEFEIFMSGVNPRHFGESRTMIPITFGAQRFTNTPACMIGMK